MHAPRPSRHLLWRGIVLPVLIVAACTHDEVPVSVPAAAKQSAASPLARQSPGITQGSDVHAAPTVATESFTEPGSDESHPAQATATNEGLHFEIEADPDIGKAPLTVHFAAVADEDLPAPLSYRWDFGDGSDEESSPVAHTYDTPGEYTATLTVADSTGRSATRDVQIQVDPIEHEGDGTEQ